MSKASEQEQQMGRRMQIAPHVVVDEVPEKLKATANSHQREKWLLTANLLVDARPADTIIPHTHHIYLTKNDTAASLSRLIATAEGVHHHNTHNPTGLYGTGGPHCPFEHYR